MQRRQSIKCVVMQEYYFVQRFNYVWLTLYSKFLENFRFTYEVDD